MVSEVKKVLVVGGGIAGMSAAMSLRKYGIEVDLIDLDPQWRVYGAGITITGPTLRALRSLGVLDEVLTAGATADGLKVCAVGGQVLSEIETPRLGEGIPGAGGILRPALHKILSQRTRDTGVRVRLGISVDQLVSRPEGADVTFTDGSGHRYDAVIGADGVFSRVRTLVFPNAPAPAFTGQACWRLMMPRAPTVNQRHFFLGGAVKIGLNPVSDTEMYLFLLEGVADKQRFADERLHVELARLMTGYGGILADIRSTLSARSRIVHRPLESVLLPHPWHCGRTLLIGDAAHATTPQLASGAGLAVEDGLVIAEELQRGPTVTAAFERFMDRRFERCRMVVENSLKLGSLEVQGASVQAQQQLLERSLAILAQDI